MINQKLISPRSIVVIGGSEDTGKPGGTVLKNLITTHFQGNTYVVNPKAEGTVQGCQAFKSAEDLPFVDLAILAIPAKFCPDTVDVLCNKKNCGAIIILSAGFGEDSPEGATLEKRIVSTVNAAGATLIGPNCIGAITPHYAGVFTQPIPHLAPNGIDFISGSGATIVFILETGMMSIELSSGQMVEDVRLAVNGRIPVGFYGRMGGSVPSPEEILDAFVKFIK